MCSRGGAGQAENEPRKLEVAGVGVPHSQSGCVSMKRAVGLAKDKSGTFAYKFQRIEAIKKKKKISVLGQ